MPYKHVVKVSDEVYRKLWELTRKHNLESPNQLLEKLLVGSERVTLSGCDRVTPSPSHGVTLSGQVQVSLWHNDPFWYLIRVGEGLYATEISLNIIQMTKLCNTGLLAEEVCEKARRLRG
jgi:hypothetical protein